jgi:hypothetical protein
MVRRVTSADWHEQENHILTHFSYCRFDLIVAIRFSRLYGTKSTAFLWVRSDYQSSIVPAILSNTQNYIAEFEYIGTRDYTSWASLNATFNFRTWLGDAPLKAYIKQLADEGAAYLVDLWGTELGVPSSMTHAMTNIRLPTSNGTLVGRLTHTIAREYDMEVVVYQRPTGVFWTRVSTQIYHEMSDFHFLGQTILAYFNVTASAGGRGTRFPPADSYPTASDSSSVSGHPTEATFGLLDSVIDAENQIMNA